jgi:mannose-6-phosphate isomerase-like protein (cupin superfamily)
VIPPNTTWTNPRTGASLTVIEHSAQRSLVERTMVPHTGRADRHVHLDLDQSWWAVQGTLTCEVNGVERRIRPGERVDIPRGTPHRDPFNESDEPIVWRSEFRPNTLFVEVFIRTFGELMERDDLNESWKAGPPVWLQRPVVALGAAIARLRGFRPAGVAESGDREKA